MSIEELSAGFLDIGDHKRVLYRGRNMGNMGNMGTAETIGTIGTTEKIFDTLFRCRLFRPFRLFFETEKQGALCARG
jgi:hypothetical protein